MLDRCTRKDITLDHAAQVALLDAVTNPAVRPYAGRSPIVGDAVVYILDIGTLQVTHVYMVSRECLAVLTDQLCAMGHEAGPEFAAILATLEAA